jgi:hypothetical protein
MRKLLLAVLVAGCSSSSPNTGAAHVGATWQIKNTAGASQGCPTGFDTASLINQPVDTAGNNVGSPIIDLFDCAAGQGTSAGLPATTYKTFIEITDHSGANIYATSVPAFLDVTTTDLTYNTDILTDGGYFALAWILKGATSNNTLTCAQAGVSGSASGVEAISTVANSTSAATDQFTCDDGSGVTSGLPAGTYTVSVDAFTSAGAVGTAPTLSNKVIQSPNVVTDLGTITIPITGM